MLDYPALAALAAVVHEGSFERAATRLGITPSAVSQRVRALEERVGAILIRRGQPCRPTDVGLRLSAHADRVRLMEDDVVAALPTASALLGSRPPLRIAVNADSLATWFPAALADFSAETGSLLELVLDDEEHTADRLRSGEVVAAVTADPAPVPGCRIVPLGSMTYAACASPAYMDRFFSRGVDAMALADAPALRFDRRDNLQARWTRDVFDVALSAPTHWVPTTQGFVDLALAGLGWGMQVAPLVQCHLEAGRLREMVPGRRLDVGLQWQVTRLDATRLDHLTRAVRSTARRILRSAS